MRPIGVFGKTVTGWQLTPAADADFEPAALRAARSMAPVPDVALRRLRESDGLRHAVE